MINYALPLHPVSVVRQGSQDRRYYIYLPPEGTLLYSIDAADNRRRFYHFDEIGTTLFLTDDAGAITDTYAITPYGEQVDRTGSAENPFTFLGAYGVTQEGSTGLYYMGFRWYDSTTARFLTRDPLPGLAPKALNRYQYAFGNPLVSLDPQGKGSRAGRAGNQAEGIWGQLVLEMPELLRRIRGSNENIAPRLTLGILQILRGAELRKETDRE